MRCSMALGVTFHPYALPHQNEDAPICSICLNEEAHTEWIAHEAMHPLHTRCLQAWLRTRHTCPNCRADINIFSVFSWKESALILLRIQDEFDPETLDETPVSDFMLLTATTLARIGWRKLDSALAPPLPGIAGTLAIGAILLVAEPFPHPLLDG